MKTVVITNKGSLFGLKLLNELKNASIKVHGVICVHQDIGYYLMLLKNVLRRVGPADTLYFLLKRIFYEKIYPPPKGRRDCSFIKEYEKLALSVYEVMGTNSRQTLACLRALSPDILLLGQAGVVNEEVLQIPAMGTLNAHTGLLPYYRGIDCARWALLHGEEDKVGVSVHWVDKGIDTGPVIETRRYSIQREETLRSLDEYLDDLAVSLMSEVMGKIDSGKVACGTPQTRETGTQYYKMSRSGEQEVGKALKKGYK